MQTNVFTLGAVALCLSGAHPLRAQMPEDGAVPKVLLVMREQIKEGREAAHSKTEEAWPRIYRKGNFTTYSLAMTSETGAAEAWFLEPHDSFAGMEKDRAAIQNSPLAGDLEAAETADGEMRTGSRVLVAVFRGELSYAAAEAMASLPKCRHISVTLLRIRYGRDADLVQAAKLLIAGDQMSNSAQPVLTYQVVSGGPAGLYLLFSPMATLARLDDAPARSAAARQAMGEHNRQRFDGLAADTVQSAESLLFAVNPAMSYVSKEFAAADPAFWNPRPKPPAKPAVRRKHPPAA